MIVSSPIIFTVLVIFTSLAVGCVIGVDYRNSKLNGERT